jgi:hypothetical protein
VIKAWLENGDPGSLRVTLTRTSESGELARSYVTSVEEALEVADAWLRDLEAGEPAAPKP